MRPHNTRSRLLVVLVLAVTLVACQREHASATVDTAAAAALPALPARPAGDPPTLSATAESVIVVVAPEVVRRAEAFQGGTTSLSRFCVSLARPPAFVPPPPPLVARIAQGWQPARRVHTGDDCAGAARRTSGDIVAATAPVIWIQPPRIAADTAFGSAGFAGGPLNAAIWTCRAHRVDGRWTLASCREFGVS